MFKLLGIRRVWAAAQESVIEPESRDAFVANTFIDAAMQAKSAHPDKKSFVIRIGYDAAVHIGAATK